MAYRIQEQRQTSATGSSSRFESPARSNLRHQQTRRNFPNTVLLQQQQCVGQQSRTSTENFDWAITPGSNHARSVLAQTGTRFTVLPFAG
jgi:hypothetical protein